MSSSSTHPDAAPGRGLLPAPHSDAPHPSPARAPGPEVTAADLVVRYGRRGTEGLRGLSARFGPGICGLVGPNGAGKSTLLRSICGLVPISGGRLAVGGLDPRSYVGERGVGFLPESPSLPPYLTAGEFLEGLVEGEGKEPAPGPVGGMQGLEALRPRRMDTLSQGQRKKVALAAALVGNPALLLLDEPTNGLDPAAVRELRETLTVLGGEGRTLVVSSHHLDELQRVADVLVFVEEGRSLGCWSREEALAEQGSFDALYERVFLGRRS